MSAPHSNLPRLDPEKERIVAACDQAAEERREAGKGPELLLAFHILNGTPGKIPDREDYYPDAEWQKAALDAVEGDCGDLRFMIRQAALYAEYREDTSNDPAWDGDFSDWLERPDPGDFTWGRS